METEVRGSRNQTKKTHRMLTDVHMNRCRYSYPYFMRHMQHCETSDKENCQFTWFDQCGEFVQPLVLPVRATIPDRLAARDLRKSN